MSTGLLLDQFGISYSHATRSVWVAPFKVMLISYDIDHKIILDTLFVPTCNAHFVYNNVNTLSRRQLFQDPIVRYMQSLDNQNRIYRLNPNTRTIIFTTLTKATDQCHIPSISGKAILRLHVFS